MSILTAIRRAFGFSVDVDEDDDDFTSTPTGYHSDAPEAARPEAAPAYQKPVTEPSPAPVSDNQEARMRMLAEVDRLNTALKKVSAERDNYQRQQLSAERQKRALTDRIYDLEHKLTTLEGERDKLYVENRTLAVQLKNVGIKPAQAPTAQLTDDSEVAALRSRIEERDATIDDLRRRLAASEESVEALNRDIKTAEVKSRMADTMVADLTTKAATANRELEEARGELREAEKVLASIDRIEEVHRKKDMRIAELQRSVALKDKEIRSLNSTIEHNLRRHAEAEQLLRREIDSLRSGRRVAESRPAQTPDSEPRKEKRPKHDRSDDSQLSLW